MKAQVAGHVLEIHRRRVGYAFGGPDPAWCNATEAQGMELPEDPNARLGDQNTPHRSFTGCLKYAECDLIPDSVRWRP
jgi:hypothetical protein